MATKHNKGKLRWALLPMVALAPVVRVLEYGEGKYPPKVPGGANWREGPKYFKHTELLEATYRHLFAYAGGEDNDSETGLPHLAHALCELIFLMYYTLFGLGTDDRYKLKDTPRLDDTGRPILDKLQNAAGSSGESQGETGRGQGLRAPGPVDWDRSLNCRFCVSARDRVSESSRGAPPVTDKGDDSPIPGDEKER